MVATRSHHHCADLDRAGRVGKSDTLPTEKECRFDLASSIPGYAAWFKANRPDEYAEWLKIAPSDRITRVEPTPPAKSLESASAREIQGIWEQANVLCLPTPKVEAVITVDLTALVKVYEARSMPMVAHKAETYEKSKVVEPVKPAPQPIKEAVRYTFRPGQHITARNGRNGVIHVIMDQTIRVYIENTSLSFRTIEYYTSEELMELNPKLAKAA